MKKDRSEYNRTWRLKNSERCRQFHKRYYAEHREEQLLKSKERYRRNRLEILKRTATKRLENRDEVNRRHRGWYRRNREKVRDKQLRYKYGISSDQYRGLLKHQGGSCALCGRSPKKNKSLSVDHDHKTKKVRGLLCQDCNVALGLFLDSKKTFRKAIKYLTNPPANELFPEKYA